MVEGQSILVDHSSGNVCLLGAIGSALWDCFDGVATVEEIMADARDQHDFLGASAEGHVLSFARELERLGMLTDATEGVASSRNDAPPETVQFLPAPDA